MKKDYSQEIFEDYYSSGDKILEVTLKDGTKLSGIFVSFFRGDESSGPYIIKWHFIEEPDIEKHKRLFSIDGSDDLGRIIEQEEILSVKFKK